VTISMQNGCFYCQYSTAYNFVQYSYLNKTYSRVQIGKNVCDAFPSPLLFNFPLE